MEVLYMSKELFEKRKIEFKNFITIELRMPKVWEVRFSDSEDMRLWFNKISKLENFKDFVNEINIILGKYNLKILSDKEKEQEFMNYIEYNIQIPLYGEAYFSDNDEMRSWYMSYREKNRNFETIVHNNLKEYQELDLAFIWSFIKSEFIAIIKKLKRIPNHGEVIIQDGIDVRVIYDKLESFDPEFTEKLLLHLQTYNSKKLSIDDRIKELLLTISNLGYIPFLQESRFSDGTDMFTWYNRYKNVLPNLDKDIQLKLTKEKPKRKVNIYLIPNFKNKGGKFYTICTNVGERLDLSNISSFDEAKAIDDTLVKRGGVILKQNEEIESIDFVKGRTK